MNCHECKHDQHEPGQCKRCNCGESAISRTTSYRELEIVIPSGNSSLTGYGYDMGHRVPKRREA